MTCCFLPKKSKEDKKTRCKIIFVIKSDFSLMKRLEKIINSYLTENVPKEYSPYRNQRALHHCEESRNGNIRQESGVGIILRLGRCGLQSNDQHDLKSPAGQRSAKATDQLDEVNVEMSNRCLHGSCLTSPL